MSKRVFQSTPDFIEIRCSQPEPFYFARRKGKDSIAIMVYDRTRAAFLIRMQPLVHIADGDSQELFPCPITGSIDVGESSYDAAMRELKEETGYQVDALRSLSSYVVGTQTDEVVHLFFADVTGLPQMTGTQDGTFHESISKNEWFSVESLKSTMQEECYSGLVIGFYRALHYMPKLK